MRRTTFAAIVALAALLPHVARAEIMGLANPAAVLCIHNGGHVEIETAADGGQRGICVFPDGTRIDEWTYFRNTHRKQ